MLEELFTSVIATEGITVPDFLTCLAGSLVLGAILAFVFTYRSKTDYTKSFVGTLLILPAVVAIVIMMVSGSIGTGIAVAGTFSLVRFRSIPGTAREISAIFLAMAVGLACGMGYLGFAAVFTAAIIITMKFKDIIDSALFYLSVPKCVGCKDRLLKSERALLKDAQIFRK